MEFKNAIKKSFKECGINLTDEMYNKFEIYYNLLIKTNENVNLTAITDKKEVFYKHFLDSVLPHALIKKNAFVCDIGSGAGFPAIPLKIVRPDIEFVLIDSLNKRVMFLNEVCSQLKLSGIKNLHFRAEQLATKPELREKFDYCIARGVARLNTLSEYCLPFIKNGGQLIAYKAKDVEQEVLEAKNAFNILGATENVVKIRLFGTDIIRSFVIVTKNKKIDKKYPRGQNKPKMQPL